jgi:hypothetical protein
MGAVYFAWLAVDIIVCIPSVISGIVLRLLENAAGRAQPASKPRVLVLVPPDDAENWYKPRDKTDVN